MNTAVDRCDALPPPILFRSCLYPTAIAAWLAAVRSQWLRWSALDGVCALSASPRASSLDFSATNAASWWLTTIRERPTPRTPASYTCWNGATLNYTTILRCGGCWRCHPTDFFSIGILRIFVVSDANRKKGSIPTNFSDLNSASFCCLWIVFAAVNDALLLSFSFFQILLKLQLKDDYAKIINYSVSSIL